MTHTSRIIALVLLTSVALGSAVAHKCSSSHSGSDWSHSSWFKKSCCPKKKSCKCSKKFRSKKSCCPKRDCCSKKCPKSCGKRDGCFKKCPKFKCPKSKCPKFKCPKFCDKQNQCGCGCPTSCPSCDNPRECPDKECCPIEQSELAFQAHLNFDQIVVRDDNFGLPAPRPDNQRPSDNNMPGRNEVFGKFEICFNKECTKANYKLRVFNVNKGGTRNPLERVRGAWICFGSAANPTEIKTEIFGPIAFLCGLNNPGSERLGGSCEGTNFKEGDFCCCGTLTNKDLAVANIWGTTPLPEGLFTPTIAALKELMRSELTFIILNGCDDGGSSGKPQYGLISGGLARAQIFPRETGFGTAIGLLNLLTVFGSAQPQLQLGKAAPKAN